MTPAPAVKVLDRGLLAPPDEEAYQAFPTVTRAGPGRILAAFRQGRTGEDWAREAGAHGSNGDVLLAESRDEGRSFGPPRLLIDHRTEETNEHDSLITGLGQGRVLLITRSYGTEVNESFWSLSRDQGKTFGPRRTIRIKGLELDPEWGSASLAFYGHALEEGGEGGLLLSFYANVETTHQQAGLARFDPQKGAFELWGWIREGELRSCYLNETPLIRLSGGEILALPREEPCLSGLHMSFSRDNGKSFGKPRSTWLFGEAANLAALPDGRLLAIFRGLSQNPEQGNSVSLSVSGDRGRTWSRPYVLEEYRGGRFHGGYGDLVATESGAVLAVYYVCDEDADPVVKRCLFEVKE